MAQVGSTDLAPNPARVRLSAVLTLSTILLLFLAGALVPITMFFAVGAGAGYALSGSV